MKLFFYIAALLSFVFSSCTEGQKVEEKKMKASPPVWVTTEPVSYTHLVSCRYNFGGNFIIYFSFSGCSFLLWYAHYCRYPCMAWNRSFSIKFLCRIQILIYWYSNSGSAIRILAGIFQKKLFLLCHC